MMDQPTATSADPDTLDAFLGVPPVSQRNLWLKRAAIAVGVILLCLLLWRCFGASGAKVDYATVPVRSGDLTVTVSATGNIQPTNQVQVGSEISGLVTKVNVDNNDRVTKGEILAQIDISRLTDTLRQSQAAVNSAQAQVAQAQATVGQSRANLARYEQVFKLSGGKVPSGTELDTARADFARAVAAVHTAQAQVAQAQAQFSSDQTQLSKASIRSPVNGVVLSRQIEPGQTVAASLNAPVLFQIAEDLRRMRLEVKVDEADVGQVSAGQRATFSVDAFPGRTFPAMIERVDVGANASTTSGTSTATTASSVVAYTARLTVDNPEELLRQGMTATADIVTMEKKNVLLVPNAALRFSPDRAGRKGAGGGITSVLVPQRPGRGGGAGGGGAAPRTATIGRGSKQTIYVKGEDGTPQAVSVTVGESDGSQTEVRGPGLRAGMQVITGQLAAGDTSAKSGSGSGQRRRAGQGSGQGNGG